MEGRVQGRDEWGGRLRKVLRLESLCLLGLCARGCVRGGWYVIDGIRESQCSSVAACSVMIPRKLSSKLLTEPNEDCRQWCLCRQRGIGLRCVGCNESKAGLQLTQRRWRTFR